MEINLSLKVIEKYHYYQIKFWTYNKRSERLRLGHSLDLVKNGSKPTEMEHQNVGGNKESIHITCRIGF